RQHQILAQAIERGLDRHQVLWRIIDDEDLTGLVSSPELHRRTLSQSVRDGGSRPGDFGQDSKDPSRRGGARSTGPIGANAATDRSISMAVRGSTKAYRVVPACQARQRHHATKDLKARQPPPVEPGSPGAPPRGGLRGLGGSNVERQLLSSGPASMSTPPSPADHHASPRVRAFSPLQLAGLRLRNRFVKSATYEGMSPGGRAGAALLEHHA